MSLSSDIDDLLTPKGNPCKWERIRSELTDEDRKKLDALVERVPTDRPRHHGDVGYSTVAKILTRNGHAISNTAISNHFGESCSCVAK